jgi:hypothetical protein
MGVAESRRVPLRDVTLWSLPLPSAMRLHDLFLGTECVADTR